MVPCPEDVRQSESANATSTVTVSSYARQNSSKRRNSDYDEKNDFTDIAYKRGRAIDNPSGSCPIADFGCLTDTLIDNWLEHFSSKIHQESLMKAIEFYGKTSHLTPKNNSNLLENKETTSEIMESIDMLAEGVACLHDDNVQLHTSMIRMNNNLTEQQNQTEKLKSSVEETRQIMQATQINNNILQTELETMKQTMVDLLSRSSNDGTYIWKISNVAQKISDALAEKQTSIYSAPFYSSPNGYKMCMRLYFNGDGQARKTHLSLFFVLMRGEYDAILSWPFLFKITFCLYDQTNGARHIFDSFRPDGKSNSFQRPRTNMNIASGIPKFFPLPIIQQDNNPYVRDDCMFIRCMVDFVATPKIVIPYICGLNPGLPSLIQRTMIQAEIERHNSLQPTITNSSDSSIKKDSL